MLPKNYRKNRLKVGSTWIHKNCEKEAVRVANLIRSIPLATKENADKAIKRLQESVHPNAKKFLEIFKKEK